uniref:Uncharacterized protein n=1 Tax=Rhizophora mucronata TaxID=61149 RepID=A0A2P2QJI0_RHIMU
MKQKTHSNSTRPNPKKHKNFICQKH